MAETGKPRKGIAGDYIEECGCQYTYVTTHTHTSQDHTPENKLYVDICADHYEQGRR